MWEVFPRRDFLQNSAKMNVLLLNESFVCAFFFNTTRIFFGDEEIE